MQLQKTDDWRNPEKLIWKCGTSALSWSVGLPGQPREKNGQRSRVADGKVHDRSRNWELRLIWVKVWDGGTRSRYLGSDQTMSGLGRLFPVCCHWRFKNGVGETRKEKIPGGLTTSRKQQTVFQSVPDICGGILGEAGSWYALAPSEEKWPSWLILQVQTG